jgi:hypothetical protein
LSLVYTLDGWNAARNAERRITIHLSSSNSYFSSSNTEQFAAVILAIVPITLEKHGNESPAATLAAKKRLQIIAKSRKNRLGRAIVNADNFQPVVLVSIPYQDDIHMAVTARVCKV